MRIFTIFEPQDRRPDPEDPGQGVIFIKEGFCWPALFIPFLWMLYHRMWFVAAGYVAASLIVALVGQLLPLSEVVSELIVLGFGLIVALEGNDLRRWHLERKDYAHVATVAAPDLERAEHRYFANRRDFEAVSKMPARGPATRNMTKPWGFMLPDARS